MRLSPLPAIALGFGLAACASEPARPPAPPTPPPVAAAPAPSADVADLNGARASSGEAEMQRRGYTSARTRGLTTYWWNASVSRCVQTTTSQGRYSVVRTVAASNCGH